MSTLNQYYSSLATDPLRQFRFTAKFSVNNPFDARISSSDSAKADKGFSTGWVGGFTNISGLEVTTQNVPYREGGFNTTVHQVPGMTTFSPVTFTRGVLYGNDQAITWVRGIFAAGTGMGLNPGSATNRQFRCDITIEVNDHPNTDVNKDYSKMAFKIHNAWITSVRYSDLDATNGAILFETMQVVHEGISVYFTDKDGNPTDPTIKSLSSL